MDELSDGKPADQIWKLVAQHQEVDVSEADVKTSDTSPFVFIKMDL